MVFGPALDAGLVLLLAVVFAEYFKWRTKSRGFTWIATGGVFLIFAGTFGAIPLIETYLTADVWLNLQAIFAILGWLFALVGTIIVGYETLVER